MSTLTAYKGYTIETVGISHSIYRPGTWNNKMPLPRDYAPGYAQSMSAAKFWINSDIAQQMGREEREETR